MLYRRVIPKLGQLLDYDGVQLLALKYHLTVLKFILAVQRMHPLPDPELLLVNLFTLPSVETDLDQQPKYLGSIDPRRKQLLATV